MKLNSIIIFFLLGVLNLSAENYTLKDCIDYAISHNHEIGEVSYNSVEYISGRKQAEDARNPQFSIMTYTAPMYKITGDALSYDRDYNVWGPYIHSELKLQMPIYTWGKIDAYINAANNGVKVAENEKLQKTNEVIYEVKKYYHSYLLARTLKKVVEDMKKILDEAIEKAQKLYEEGNGEVKKSDLEKLKVYLGEAEKYLHESEKGVLMARLALMQKMGMSENKDFEIEESKLNRISYELRDVDYYIELAFKKRPEWNMLKTGIKAKEFLLEAEKADRYPVFFLGGSAVYSKAWVVKDQKNPWLNDEFNNFYGGVAVGAKFDFAPKTLNAKIEAKKAEVDKLYEKEKFARDGIILQVKNSYYTAKEAYENITSARKAMDAADKWVIAAGITYGLGTGDVKDALEGLAAKAKTQKDYYQAIFDYNMAVAELEKNCGLLDIANEK